MRRRTLLRRLTAGALHNVRFDDFVDLVSAFGFSLVRSSGSHHIFSHSDITELINLQDVNGQAKPYQIRQLLRLVERYNLKMENDS